MKNFYPTLSKKLILLFSLVVVTVYGQNPSQDGQWSDPIGFGLVPVAVANLPDGRLLTWSSQFRDSYIGAGDGATFTEIFDPFLGSDGQALGEFTSNTDHDMFCPGINNLADGRILSAGGTSSTKTSIYDWQTGVWSVASEMNIPRGYQGNVTLSDGSVFTLGGSWSDGDDPATNGGKDAELWTPETGWSLLPGIQGADIFNAGDMSRELQGLYRIDNHLWLWPASNGQLFHAGPSEEMHWIDVSNGGSITSAGNRSNDTYSMKGTTVMYDIDKILKVGGAESYGSSDPAFVPAKDNSYVIDISNPASVSVTPTVNNLSFSRTMHNSTVLPNGEVLVTGGLDRAEVFSDVGARLTAELYDPATNSWRNVAGMATPRTYHSVAILMVDGRVFVGGGGLCDSSNLDECVNHFDAEIYSPPYLFNTDGSLATRPTISAPDTADYNTAISVTGTSGIQEFSLIRFSAATHSTNNEQRRIPVSFSTSGSDYNVNIPDRNLLPPGYYMLFALNGDGVPSIAETIQIGNAVPLQNNPNLLLSLDFDEGSGTSIADSSGNGNDATIIERDDAGNQIPLTQNNLTNDGLFGGALEMDGIEFDSNSLVEIPYSSSMADIEDEITVMAWIYRDENARNAGVFSHDYPAIFFGTHNSLYKWEFPTTEGAIRCYSGYVPTGRWVHIAATYDGETGRLFANGVEICTRTTTGTFILNDTDPELSKFTVSGFYDVRPISDSGITDELDGKIDQLRVFNKALGAEEINNVFMEGQSINTSVPNCPDGTITLEYRVGSNGSWQTGELIDVLEGQEVYIRANVPSGEEYFVTTNIVDGPTFSSIDDLPTHGLPNVYRLDTFVSGGDGLIGLNNEGQFVVTTLSGCADVVSVKVTPACGPGSTPIIPEYRIDGTWLSGASELTLDEGTDLRLSALPNEANGGSLRIEITLPDGTVVGDNYDLPNISGANEGTYIMTSAEGCTTTLTLTVTQSSCPAGSVIPEYTLDGVTQSGAGTLVVDEGTEVILSMLPDGVGLTITLPDGTEVGDNYNLGNVTAAQNGRYTFTTAEGCTETLDMTVQAPGGGCATGTIIPEYRINGQWLSGSNDITVEPGSEVILSMLPNGIDLTITLPDGSTGGDDYRLTDVTSADNGAYLLTSAEGCQTTINLTVEDDGCTPTSVIPEYTLDGVTQSGAGTLVVDEGTEVILSMLPDGVGLTITLPDGTDVGDNYNLGNVTAAQNGRYTFTSAEGCSATLDMTVQAPGGGCATGSIIPEYRINGQWLSGSNDITVEPGSEVILSMLPNGIDLTITLPDGSTGGDDYRLTGVTAADNGAYLLTSAEGCQTTINLTVEDDGCTPTSVIPEYTLDGVTQSGAGTLTVDEGTEVILSMLPDGVGLTITLPDGTDVGDNYNLGNVTAAQNGRYTFTSAEGCSATLDMTVQAPGGGCATGSIIPEYRINGQWLSGSNDITVEPGSEVLLSMLPNDIGLTITLPDGSTGGDNYRLTGVTSADNGAYLLTSAEGCQTTINLTVEDDGCTPASVIPEYTLDGVTQSGAGTLTVDEGTEVILSMLPDGVGLTVTLPDGTDVGDNYNLGNVTAAQNGRYTFTSADGCSATLDMTVQAPGGGCATGSIIPEYRINGQWLSGSNDITVEPGSEVLLSMLPNDIGLTIMLPDGSTGGDNYRLTGVTAADSGAYLLTSAEGCQTTINLTVEDDGCTPTSVIPEYILDGVTQSGAGTLVVDEGTEVILSMLPDGVGLTITLPDGTDVGDNYSLGNVTAAQNGRYTFTSAEGCSATLDMTVQAPGGGCATGSIIPEYRINTVWLSGSNDITVEPGSEVILSMLPNGIDLTITLPDGSTGGDDYRLTDVTAADSGAYLLTSAEGCQTTINLTVEESVGPLASRANVTESVDMSVFPNPLREQLNISLELSNPSSQPVQVDIYDMTGRLVARERVIYSGFEGEMITLDMTALPQGVYTLVVQSTEGNMTQRVIKE